MRVRQPPRSGGLRDFVIGQTRAVGDGTPPALPSAFAAPSPQTLLPRSASLRKVDPLMEPLDCRTCGACCRGRPGTVLVDPDDLARFRAAGRDDLAASLAPGHFSLDALPAHDDGQCVYQGTATSRSDCSIYEIRPDSCRRFERGSTECLSARQHGRRDG